MVYLLDLMVGGVKHFFLQHTPAAVGMSGELEASWQELTSLLNIAPVKQA